MGATVRRGDTSAGSLARSRCLAPFATQPHCNGGVRLFNCVDGFFFSGSLASATEPAGSVPEERAFLAPNFEPFGLFVVDGDALSRLVLPPTLLSS